MKKKRGLRGSERNAIHLPSTWQRMVELVRGRDQRLVRPGVGYPLLLLNHPRGHTAAIDEIETILAHGLPLLPHRILQPYAGMFGALPVMVTVILRPYNPCGCLGHFHPRGTESRLTRRLTMDLGSYVGELDLAYEAIRQWAPRPLSALATGELGGRLRELHFEAALLAVFLHELEHVAYPNRGERDVRGASDEFYLDLMRELVDQEGGGAYGLRSAV